MGRFEDGVDRITLDAAHDIYLPRERRQRAGAGQGRQRRRPAGRVQPVRHRVRRHRRVLSGGRLRPAPEGGRVAAHRADSRICRTTQIVQVGNAAIEGACIALLSRAQRAGARGAGQRVEHCRLETHRLLRFLRRRLPVQAGRVGDRGGGMIELDRHRAATWTSSRPSTCGCSAIRADWVLEGRARSLATGRATGMPQHGRPWIYAREVDAFAIDDGAVVASTACVSPARGCDDAARRPAPTARSWSPSAPGPELEAEAQRALARREAGRVLLPRGLGSAVVEHLVTMTGARLCAWAGRASGWRCCRTTAPAIPSGTSPSSRALLDADPRAGSAAGGAARGARVGHAAAEEVAAGGLRPDAARRSRAAADASSSPARTARSRPASTGGRRTAARARRRRRAAERRRASCRRRSARAARSDASYSVNAKALQRWASERLTLDAARRRHASTRCSATKARPARNMGRPLQFHYHVTLGPRDDGYPIREQCAARRRPATTGYTLHVPLHQRSRRS